MSEFQFQAYESAYNSLRAKYEKLERDMAAMAVENAELREQLAAKDAELERVRNGIKELFEYAVHMAEKYVPLGDSNDIRSACISDMSEIAHSALASPAAEPVQEVDPDDAPAYIWDEPGRACWADGYNAALAKKTQPAPVAQQLDIEDQLKEAAMTEQLKPCPCGKEAKCIAEKHAEFWEAVAGCAACDVYTSGRWDRVKENAQISARNAWNRHVEPERKVEPVAWIPVSERLPKPYEVVRFYPEIATDPIIDRGYFDNEGRCWYNEYTHGGIETVRHERTTHWQPITAPKEQSDE